MPVQMMRMEGRYPILSFVQLACGACTGVLLLMYYQPGEATAYESIRFLTVPRTSYVLNANRDQLVEPEAARLFARLRADKPVAVAKEPPQGPGQGRSPHSVNLYGNSFRDHEEESAGDGMSTAIGVVRLSGTPDPAPTFRGSTAAQDACG